MTNPADDAALRAQRALRVGDVERNSAIEALGEHLTAGRITLDEYGDRSAHIMVAATCGDLAAVFDDLPGPHPKLPGPYAAALLPPPGNQAAPARRTDAHALASRDQRSPAQQSADQRSRAQKIVAVLASLSVFAALALFFITGTWLWFLLIPAISGIAGAIWGPDWKEPRPGQIDGGQRRELE